MSDRPLHEGKLDRAQALSNARQEASYETISVTPITPVIGVEIEGVDLTEDVPEAQIADLDLGPEGLVQRYGYLSNEDMICYVRAADLVVLPYREIYQSGVVFLAYTFGRAVLATRVGSFPETVEEGRSGWLVEPEDVPGLSRALVAALSAPDKLREAGDYARHLADTRYGWPDIARQTEKVYRRALEDE